VQRSGSDIHHNIHLEVFYQAVKVFCVQKTDPEIRLSNTAPYSENVDPNPL